MSKTGDEGRIESREFLPKFTWTFIGTIFKASPLYLIMGK